MNLLVAVHATAAALGGILYTDGPGPSEFTSVHGNTVILYGRGFYRHMSHDVAPQGIAQDYVTLLLGVPALIVALFAARRGSLRGQFALAGISFYFLVTYLFYTMMAMYSALFLLHVALLSFSFFAFAGNFRSLRGAPTGTGSVTAGTRRFVGGFLVFSSTAIALLWLSVVVPPLLEGRVPGAVEHYTTLVVQAFDLAILLPISFLTGCLYWRDARPGRLLAPVYSVFLALLMTALTAKVLAMHGLGQPVTPAIVMIPIFNACAIAAAALSVKAINTRVVPEP